MTGLLVCLHKSPYSNQNTTTLTNQGKRCLGRQNKDINAITLADIEKQKGNFLNNIDLKKGDLIAAYLENYFDKTVILMRIDDLQSGRSVTFSLKYLVRSKTAYSDDKD